MSPTEQDKHVNDAILSQQDLLQALQRLLQTLTAMDPSSQTSSENKAAAYTLSHWRKLPAVIVQAHDILTQGAGLIHATSTKYTLLGRIDHGKHETQQFDLSKDLLQGCQLIATACLVLSESGSSKSSVHYVIQASRAIVNTVVQLVESFVSHEALDTENLGAQRTGAVWSACEVVINKQVPKGNRNAMRRALLTFLQECQETMSEFQDLIEMGVSDDDEEDESEQYTTTEMPVAQACVALIKCSRGSINAALQACESVGSLADAVDDDKHDESDNHQHQSAEKTRLFAWLAQIHELACAVGDNMTELGCTLYPPLEKTAVQAQIDQQTSAIQAVMTCILTPPPTSLPSETTKSTPASENGSKDDATAAASPDTATDSAQSSTQSLVGNEAFELANKLQKAVVIRHKEATEALDKMSASQET
jgi:Grap2 and cyclin-D-interacting